MTPRTGDRSRHVRIPRGVPPLLLAAGLLSVTACGDVAGSDAVAGGTVSPISAPAVAPTSRPAARPSTSAPVPTAPTTTAPTTTRPTGPPTEPSTTPSTTTSPTTTPPPATTIAAPPPTVAPAGDMADPGLTFLRAAVDALVADTPDVSVTVLRDGLPILAVADGPAVDGSPITTDTPFVMASVSKLVTALTVARLAEAGMIDVSGRVPWTAMGLAHDPAWETVTVRDLLDHTSGMPVAQASWIGEPGSCSIPLAAALSLPPTPTRGTWRYSNGNYCALGLLVEHVTGARLDAVATQLVFGPVGITGPHLALDGPQAGDAPYAKGVSRLERLGGAGTWIASTDDIAAMLLSIRAADGATLMWPGIMADQYGWGHTGTVDGAKACAWVMDGGRIVLVAAVSGPRPASGGELCDLLVPALAVDLGVWTGEPFRTPR